jgi:SAM-dependent methyltransferase
MPDHLAPSGFDAIAERYDADENANRAFAYIRRRSYDLLRGAFAPDARLIEVGSGTGTEAAMLAAGGAALVLVDTSPRLLKRAEIKVRAARPHALLGAHLLPARRVGELTGLYGSAGFDGGFSSLGPLNCEPALEPVAAGLAELIRPGGSLVLSIMNRFCAVETAWFAGHGQWRAAARRWDGPVSASTHAGGPRDVPTWYYSRTQIQAAFSAAFRTESVEALPLLWPPTTLDFLVKRFPRLYAALEPLDRAMSGWPLLRDLGDHVLFRLRRREH